MANELTSSVPLDDELPPEVEAQDVDTEDEGAKGDESDDELGDISAEDLESITGDERGIPKPRFDEVNGERKALLEQNAALARALAEREQRAAPASAQDKPRDFDAERVALKEKYDTEGMALDEYIGELRKVDRAEDRAEQDARLQPVIKSLEQERAQITMDRLTTRLNAEAAKVYEKYPFLEIGADDANDEAIAKVVAQRDELITAGIEPIKALRLAVAAVAPEYGQPVARGTNDDLASRRKLDAQRKAAAASGAQPPQLRGTSSRVVDPGENLSGSVKDHALWEQKQRGGAA